MIKSVGSKSIKRKDSRKNLIKIISFLHDHQFSSIKEICRYDGNKNYKTTQNYINYLLDHKIIFKVQSWKGQVYYVKVKDDPALRTRINYFTTKHRMSLKLNGMMNDYYQLKQNILNNGIDDFTKISKSNIPKQPIDVTGLNDSCTVVVKFVNLIMLATKVMILEEKLTKKSKSVDSQKLVKREARICEMWLDLESFLDNDFGKTTIDAEFMCMAKSSQIHQEYKLYKDYFAHITHSKTSFSEYTKMLIQIKQGWKQEYANVHGMSMPAINKIVTKFTDKSGRIDIRYLSDMRRIENATQFKFHESDIEDLFFMDLFYDELNRTRWAYDQKSEIEKQKTRKIITQIFPKMQIA